MSDKIRVAVIGVGHMGTHHVKAYMAMDRFQIVGIADTNVSALHSEVFGVVPRYEKFEDMIREQKPDIVSVCVPAMQHFAVAAYCLRHECHVLLEKPVTVRVGEARCLQKITQLTGRQLMVGHIERFNPTISLVKELVRQEKVGRIHVVCTIRSGPFPQRMSDVDVRLDLAIHDIDLANFFLNQYPMHAMCLSKDIGGHGAADVASYMLEYGDCVAHIHTDWLSSHKRRIIELRGERGTIVADLLLRNVTVCAEHTETYTVPNADALQAEIRYFADMIQAGACVEMEHAVKALEVALCAHESSNSFINRIRRTRNQFQLVCKR